MLILQKVDNAASNFQQHITRPQVYMYFKHTAIIIRMFIYQNLFKISSFYCQCIQIFFLELVLKYWGGGELNPDKSLFNCIKCVLVLNFIVYFQY